jgi:cell wall-associated protease
MTTRRPTAASRYGITGGQTPAQLAVTSLTANRTSPQPVGTPITLTASVSGGTAPQQFKWMLFDGSNTSVVQGWSTSNTWTWTPTTANAAYQVTVWARSAASTTDAAENANSTRSLPFAINATSQGPLTLTGLTANLPAPQPPVRRSRSPPPSPEASRRISTSGGCSTERTG